MRTRLVFIAVMLLVAGATPPNVAAADAGAASLIVSAANTLDVARPSETIEIQAADIAKTLGVDDLRKIHVKDMKLAQEIVSQAIDMNDDLRHDLLIFQADLAPMETRRFTLTVGERQAWPAAKYKTYGRCSRERFDDFLWENDRVAHRMYGKALETWADEPLTSSTVDVWCKRTRRLVINDWLMVGEYHEDHGEGADFYSAGKSRGAGGSCIWENDKMACSRNYVQSRLIASGPIRIVFELAYEPWAIGRKTISEVKRVSLDAGSSFNRFESAYTEGRATDREILCAIGLKKAEGSALLASEAEGWLRTWEPIAKSNGNLGLALVFDKAQFVKTAESDGNHVVVLRLPANRTIAYYAGSAWDKSGDAADVAAWDANIQLFVKRLRAPIQVTLQPGR
jgi:unsaturated rhamnogalacturonyl hydrolase